MSPSETALPLRIGARTLWTLKRRLVRRRLTLQEVLASEPPRLAALEADEQGYLVTGLPAALADRLASSHDGLRTFTRQRYARSYAPLDMDFETYSAGFSSKSRSSLKRKARRLADRCGGSLDVRCYRSESEIEFFYRDARSVSKLSYQERRLDAGLPAGPEALAEMKRLARADRARGWLLFVDERPISYLYAPAEGETLIYAHLGYDPAFAEWSPGTLLQLEAMRGLMEEGRFRLFDFTEGDGQHKRQFARGTVDCVDLLMIRPTPGNLLAAHLLDKFDRSVAFAKGALARLGADSIRRRLRR